MPHVLSVRTRGPGPRLPRRVRAEFEELFAADLSAVRVRVTADRVGPAGAVAWAAGEDVYFRPGYYAPDTGWGRWLLAHEVAHAIQMRGAVRAAVPAGVRAELEAEADTAAHAVLAGRPVRVRPRPVCPPEQPAVPLILLLAVAAGVIIWPKDLGNQDMPVDPKTGKPPEKQKHLYETGWGYVPLVGSLDQLINGRNWFSQAVGGAFFVLDVAGAGALLKGGSALVKGVLFRLTDAAKRAMGVSARAAAGAVERKSYEALISSGAVRAVTEVEAQQLLKGLGEAGKTAVVVGANSQTSRYAYHSIVYVIVDGRMYRLHGGVSAFARGGEVTGRALEQGWHTGWTSFTVYLADDLAEAGGKGLTDAALLAAAEGWGEQFGKGVLGSIKNCASARGCAASQWVLMEQLGLPTNVTGAGRFLPYLMETGRMSGGLGNHYVVSPMTANLWTAGHVGLGMTGAAVLGAGYATAGGVAREWADGLTGPAMDQLRTAGGPTAAGPPAFLLTPVEDVDLSALDGGLPDYFTVGPPDQPGAEPESTPTRAAERIPAAGGAKRPAPAGRGGR